MLVLAGILRLAEALDRTHRQRVRSVTRVRSSGPFRLRCGVVGDPELELWGARRHVDALEAALAVSLRLDPAPAVGAG